MGQVEAGFSQKVISPEKGVSLMGYFTNRFNTGVHDDLHTKAMALSDGERRAVLVVADVAIIFPDVIADIRRGVSAQTDIPEEDVFTHCTHTHTAPALREKVWIKFSPKYRQLFVDQSVAAAVEASGAMRPVTFEIAVGEEMRVAFCRRFIMKDGTVVTNPPKQSSDIVRAESEPDYVFAVVAVKDLSGKIIGVLLHCTNHTDTVGGNLVSADWPGVLCAHITDNVASHPQAMLLNGMAGDMNHFDISNPDEQYGIQEAERIGTIYAETAMTLLGKLEPLAVSRIGVGRDSVELESAYLTDEELAEARKTIERTPVPEDLDGAFHSVDLAKGNEIVNALFAQKKLEFAEDRTSSETVGVSAMRIGDLLIAGLPFEAFSGIGKEIKRRSPFRHTFALELLNGYHGYLGTREAAERTGGMETMPGLEFLRRFVPGVAEILMDGVENVMTSLAAEK